MKQPEGYIEEFLKSLDLDLKALHMEKTPARVAGMYQQLFAGLKADPRKALGELFRSDNQGLVAIGKIPYYSVCEHHLTPFFGTVDIVYQPRDGMVAGLSKFQELVKVFAQRPQLQERLTANVADALMEILRPEGVMVQISATQLCMMLKEYNGIVPKIYTMETRGRLAAGHDLHNAALALLGKVQGGFISEESL